MENYKPWFVLNVETTKEEYFRNLIRNANKEINIRIFNRELLHTKKKQVQKVKNILFPGYIFVYKKIEQVLDILKNNKVAYYYKNICFRNKKCENRFHTNAPCVVNEIEMKFLLDNSDSTGTIIISKVLTDGEHVKIIDGPLLNLNGNIKYINFKKKKAGVELHLFNRKIIVHLGVEIIRKNLE